MSNLHPDFNKATRDLKLKLQNENSDLQEINRILFDILDYPSVEEGEHHHRASNLGTNDLLTKQAQIQDLIKLQQARGLEVCGCCGLMINNQPLPYCTKLKDINLGVGVHLFFRNYLYGALVFVSMFLIYSLYSLVTNFKAYQTEQGQYSFMCLLDDSNQSCGFSVIGAGSKVLNQNQEKNRMSAIQSYIGIAFVALWGLFNVFKTHKEEKLIVGMDGKRVSTTDFTLMLTHVPRMFLEHQGDQKKLENFQKIFNQYRRITGSSLSYEVIKINFARPLYFDNKDNEKIKKLELKKRYQRQNVFRQWIFYRQKYPSFPQQEPARNELFKNYDDYMMTDYHRNVNYEIPPADYNTIFVTLRSSKARQQIENRNRPASWKNLWHLCKKPDFPMKGVIIRRAPEPDEIRWMNAGFPVGTKVSRKVALWVFTFLLIGVSIGISIGISFINQDKISQYVSIGISLVVTAVNVGIQMVIMMASTLENQFISSVQQSNIAFKIGVGQVINSIFVPIIVVLVSNHQNIIEDKSWLKAGGLVDDVFYIAIFNLAVPFGRLVDPWEIFLKLRRWWFKSPESRLKISGQHEYNKLYGNYQFDIGYEYAYLIKTSIFTSFFAPMQPVIAAMAPIGLVLYYLIDKRNLLRHFQRPTYHSSEINSAVEFILLFSPVAFGFGNLLVNNFLKHTELGGEDNGTLLYNWIIVIVAVGFLLIVPLNIFYCCCIKKPEVQELDYHEKRAIIKSDYDRVNPKTKQTAIAEFQGYLKVLRKQQKIQNDKNLVEMARLKALKKGKVSFEQSSQGGGSTKNLLKEKEEFSIKF